MFEINTYLLNKMGWMDYSLTRGLYLNRFASNKKQTYNLFEDDPLVRFFIEFDSELFIIKELSTIEKQKSKKLYKFINVTLSPLVFDTKEFSSNIELFKLIMDSNACKGTYQRQFKINKILK